jgi:vancomycin permeability regulator SanA
MSGWFLIHTTFIVIDGFRNYTEKADVAVVLGNTVNPDGSLSARLKSRVDKALEIYHKKQVSKILVSGGTGKEKQDEALIMKKYLTEAGVPESDIMTDSQGNTTWMTAHNYLNFQKKYGFRSAIVVSQYFHLSRTKLAFRKAGIKSVFSVHADYFEIRDMYSVLREFPGYYQYLFL